jgi:hypothetical protein
VLPDIERGCQRAQPLAVDFGRNPCVVDERVQLAVQPALDLLNRAGGVVGIGQVDLDVVLGSSLPRTVLRKRVARAQPAAEKRFTVACPMPRLAPVKSRVRRG